LTHSRRQLSRGLPTNIRQSIQRSGFRFCTTDNLFGNELPRCMGRKYVWHHATGALECGIHVGDRTPTELF
jgi:hypothetical protein